MVLDERGFYSAAVRERPLVLQLFDKKNKLAAETDDYGQFLDAVLRRESKKQRAAREQLERDWAGDEERRVQAFYLEESGPRVRSRAGVASRAEGSLGLTGVGEVKSAESEEKGGKDEKGEKDALQSLGALKEGVGAESAVQRVAGAGEVKEAEGVKIDK